MPDRLNPLRPEPVALRDYAYLYCFWFVNMVKTTFIHSQCIKRGQEITSIMSHFDRLFLVHLLHGQRGGLFSGLFDSVSTLFELKNCVLSIDIAVI